MPTKAKLQEDNAALRRQIQELGVALRSQSFSEGAEASQDEPGSPTRLTAEKYQEVLESVDRRVDKLETMVLDYKEKLERSYECPITYELFKDPVFCVGDGHTYEREAILRHFEKLNTSPLTGERLTEDEKVVIPNIFVRQKADEMRGGEPDIERSNIVRQPDRVAPLSSRTRGTPQELRQELEALTGTRWRETGEEPRSPGDTSDDDEASVHGEGQELANFDTTEYERDALERYMQGLRLLQPSGGIGTSGTF